MKCIACLQTFGGGAPKSIYEYLKILVDKHFSIKVYAQPAEESIFQRYKETFDDVVIRNDLSILFERRKFYAFYKTIVEDYKCIRKEKPDLIIVQGEVNAFFYSHICRQENIPLIIIIAGGDLRSQRYLIKGWEYGQVVCFSEENKDVIKQYYPQELIHVISNRIHIDKPFECIEQHYSSLSYINILLVSRIDEDKISSIVNFLKFLIRDRNANKIVIKIAGSGRKEKELKSIVENEYGQYLNIQLLGHVDILAEEFEWAHIVVGKGRSVIEPIMMNRIGCIIGDDGSSCICTERSFDNLYHYNFSGRNIQFTDGENNLSEVVEKLLDHTYDMMKIREIGHIVSKEYSSSFLTSRFFHVFNLAKRTDNKKKKVHLFIKYLYFVMYKCVIKVKRLL